MSLENNLYKNDDLMNSMGIPAAVFVEDVENFMHQGENKENAESVLTNLDEQYGKYKFMEINLSRKKNVLKKQIPDIKASLDMLKLLKSRKDKEEPVDTHFMLCDDIYMKARIPPTDKVGLWLGANVMLEYELQDAEDLLNKNLTAAVKALSQIDSDLDFLREQLTTIEVNMARVYNWDVKRQVKETARQTPVL